MSLRLQILGSSSSGNSALLFTAHTCILIDAGIATRHVKAALAEENRTLEDLTAILLTHEHSDHINALPTLTRKHPIPLYATEETAYAVNAIHRRKKINSSLHWHLFQHDRPFALADLEIEPFPVPHDAQDPVGFLLSAGGEDLFHPRRTIAWLTDLGHIPSRLPSRLRKADLLLLEANHDPELLDSCPTRPYQTKRRIAGPHGHLSNAAARDFLAAVSKPRWQQVLLAHLSRQCNRVDLAQKDVQQPQDGTQWDFSINVIDPQNGTLPMIDCKSI